MRPVTPHRSRAAKLVGARGSGRPLSSWHGGPSSLHVAISALALASYTAFPCAAAAPPPATPEDAQQRYLSADEYGCDSPFWLRVRDVLAGGGRLAGRSRLGRDGGPTNTTLLRLAAEEDRLAEEGNGDGAACQLGRFLLSTWQLIRAPAELRTMELQNGFGEGFFGLHWRPRSRWLVFRALSRLRARALADPPGTYSGVPTCETSAGNDDDAVRYEAELLRALQASGASSVVGIAAASRFLLHADVASACPLAIAAAFLALAGSILSASGGQRLAKADEEEVMRLVRSGEEAAKAWRPEGLRFLALLVGQWPLWDILARIEALYHTALAAPARVHARLSDGNPSSVRGGGLDAARRGGGGGLGDPREPQCSRPERKHMAQALSGQRVEAIVVYGRRTRLEILHRYLLRALRKNGGVVDRVHFVVYAATRDDLAYLMSLVDANAPYYDIPTVTGRRLAKIYSICNDPETVYVKIDDDMVFLSDEAIPGIVIERLRERCSLVSANVVNHAILSAVHQDIGAIRNFFPPPPVEVGGGAAAAAPNGGGPPWQATRWPSTDEGLPMSVIEKRSQSQCVWAMWECGAWMHESFLSRLADGTDCAYDFGWHDFHSHGFGDYVGDRFVPYSHTRWSINMIAFKREDVKEALPEDLAEDDEAELSVVVPHRLSKRACAVGHALVAHFSYAKQEEGILENTDLLDRYRALSEELASADVVPLGRIARG